jgi:hypothetical protein
MWCDVKVQKPCDRLLGSGVSRATRSGTFPLSLFSSRTKQIACGNRSNQ